MALGVFSLADVNPDSGDTVASRIDDIIDYGRPNAMASTCLEETDTIFTTVSLAAACKP
jgi:hypothetical protein